MALPVLTEYQRMRKYGRSKSYIQKQLVNTTLFGVKNVYIHKKALPIFKRWEASVRAYEARYKLKPWKPKRIDSWNFRKMISSNKMSRHAYGLAVDIDPATNAYGSRHTDIPSYVRTLASKRGLKWGGTYRRTKDPMHFEWNR